MGKGWFAVVGVLILSLAGLAWLLLDEVSVGKLGSHPRNGSIEAQDVSLSPKKSHHGKALNKSTEEIQPQSVDDSQVVQVLVNEKTCSEKITNFIQTPGGERLRRWKQEIGAPYSEVLPDGTLYFPPHPYANYDNSSLLTMAEAGDVNAMYAYGMNMYWKTFTGVARSTALEEGYGFPEKSDTVDEVAFVEAEYWLYEAAVRGRLMAFIELAFMNGSRSRILKEAGNLSEREERDLEAKAFLLGNAPEELIQGYSKNHFTMDNVPKERQEKLLANQMVNFIDDYQKERIKRGLEPLVMEVPPEYELSKRICE